MKLNSISLRHAHHFADLKIEFKYSKKPITLILGEQSSGKTAILKNIYQALSWFPARFKDPRTAGVVMPDSDIMQNRVQSRIELQVQIPAEYGSLAESANSEEKDVATCTWRLYKTLNANGNGTSKVDTLELERTADLYHRAIKQDPLLGLPLIAYYPSDRFVSEVNLISKNNPAVFQNYSAYEWVALPYTTFARFFEWFREICDIENAQAAQLFQHILDETQASSAIDHQDQHFEFNQMLFQSHSQLHTPSLTALKTALNGVIPEIKEIFLEYQPKLQLMVKMNDNTIPYTQLSHTVKHWIALVGDIVRRLSLLNPKSLFPCLEGNGILLIDNIDAQLDPSTAQNILQRLNQTFPNLQIIVTALSPELLEHAEDYQYFKLAQQRIEQIDLSASQRSMDSIYQDLLGQPYLVSPEPLKEPLEQRSDVEKLFESFQGLSTEQQHELLKLMGGDDQIATPQV